MAVASFPVERANLAAAVNDAVSRLFQTGFESDDLFPESLDLDPDGGKASEQSKILLTRDLDVHFAGCRCDGRQAVR